MPAPQRTARIEDDIAQARAKAEGASLGALMRAAIQRYASGDLTSNAEPASQPQPLAASQGTPALVTAMSPGEPSHGVLCMGPGCFQRDTRTYGDGGEAPEVTRRRQESLLSLARAEAETLDILKHGQPRNVDCSARALLRQIQRDRARLACLPPPRLGGVPLLRLVDHCP